MQELPGVRATTLTLDDRACSVLAAQDQGLILAAQRGAQVVLIAAETEAALQSAIRTALGTETWSCSPTATVPVYLDKWDRYCWASGCRPGMSRRCCGIPTRTQRTYRPDPSLRQRRVLPLRPGSRPGDCPAQLLHAPRPGGGDVQLPLGGLGAAGGQTARRPRRDVRRVRRPDPGRHVVGQPLLQ